MKCLIVEDDPLTRLDLVQSMHAAGYECYETGTVAQAAYLLKTHKFSLILLDLRVPDGLTLQLTDYLQVTGCDATVILVTGTGAFPNAEHTQLAPRIDYVLTKPVNMIDLQALAEYRSKIPA